MSDINEAFLDDMRDALKAHMEADPYYADVPILSERLKDITAAVEAQADKDGGGICLLLVTPSVDEVLANVLGANFKGCLFMARTFENVPLNSTGKTALQVAIHTAALWSQLKPDTFPAPLVLTDKPVSIGADDKYLCYDVTATTEAGTKISIPRLAALTCDADDLALVTLAHETPGAAIFYTLDGSAPFPRNPSASLVQGPFSATAGQRLRARAWLAGYLPSVEFTQRL